ncbi:hypothetical protein N802_18480 [Knoellia sinensis KCTC 19936]|uniref:Pilus assembly protein n=1 Tax=Knoellia sinensis KCTC 19936 TaxID=1385520 RepID=A0A0A0J8G7_9MICO|nr:Flp family type IVb pilin [Knoellia sinensis]KGN32352.1 hypothetical protein N802_18480 [Knoellia sinensis KCTC 19936]
MTSSLIKAHIRATDKLRSLMTNEKGATAVEYGLLVALIAAVIVATVVLLGGKINGAFKTIEQAIK